MIKLTTEAQTNVLNAARLKAAILLVYNARWWYIHITRGGKYKKMKLKFGKIIIIQTNNCLKFSLVFKK